MKKTIPDILTEHGFVKDEHGFYEKSSVQFFYILPGVWIFEKNGYAFDLPGLTASNIESLLEILEVTNH